MNNEMKDYTVIPPSISKETMEKMNEFFMKTSIPRIMVAMKNNPITQEEKGETANAQDKG